jgi:hypothetical protein
MVCAPYKRPVVEVCDRGLQRLSQKKTSNPPRLRRTVDLAGSSSPLRAGPAVPHECFRRLYATPSFFCRLVDDVVYWNSSFLLG